MVWYSSKEVEGGGDEALLDSVWVDRNIETTATATTSRALEKEKESFWGYEADDPRDFALFLPMAEQLPFI